MAALIAVLAEEIERVGVATVAKRAGVSRQHLYKILAGTSHPTSENLEALSHAVSCNVAILRSKYYPADIQKEKALDGLIDLIKNLYDPQEIWIFGSQARGDWSPESDIDLMIVGRQEGGPKRGEIYVQATKRKIRVGFDAVFVSREDFEKYRSDEKSVYGNAVKEGHLVYTRSVSLKLEREEIL
jgi:predicted nucleotidyltransferase